MSSITGTVWCTFFAQKQFELSCFVLNSHDTVCVYEGILQWKRCYPAKIVLIIPSGFSLLHSPWWLEAPVPHALANPKNQRIVVPLTEHLFILLTPTSCGKVGISVHVLVDLLRFISAYTTRWTLVVFWTRLRLVALSCSSQSSTFLLH